MAKCFVTGIELPLAETYVLNIAAAYRALRDLRQRVSVLERLIEQLSPKDDVHIYDPWKRDTVIRRDRRLVSPSVAQALSAAYPEGELFMTWSEWRSRRPVFEISPVSNETAQEILTGEAGTISEKEVADAGQEEETLCSALTP